MSITCFDSDGNVLKALYQWDNNQTLTVQGLDMPPIPVFHFCNRLSNLALVVTPTVSGTSVTVNIPNILLQQAEPIIAYVYQDTENDGYRTMHAIHIPVIPRPKPDDYEYTDNVDYISVAVLNSRLNTLTQQITAVSNLGLLYNEPESMLYLTNNDEIISDGVRIVSGGFGGNAELVELTQPVTIGETECNNVQDALEALAAMPAMAALPIARGNSYDGIAYTATGDDLPTVQTGSDDTHTNHIGKGRQIVFIPSAKNANTAPTLQLNGGEIIPLRLRAPQTQNNDDQTPDATMPVTAGSLMRGVPYTLTFCGKYWLVDSHIATVPAPTATDAGKVLTVSEAGAAVWAAVANAEEVAV